MKASKALTAFLAAIEDYHAQKELDIPCSKPCQSLGDQLYHKAWIDTVQWHLEDEIRRTDLDASEVLALKRRIDALNQARTNAVEAIDKLLQVDLQPIAPVDANSLRTESLGWALDRLCILQLKRFHMAEEAARGGEHGLRVMPRLDVLNRQSEHLESAIDSLVEELRNGTVVYMRYEQHKLYNDPDTNPALYRVS
jgi:hypothetical protein